MLRKNFNYRTRFHLTDTIKGFYISTVDLGFDYNIIPDNPPLYYETMIFKKGD